MKGIAVRLGDIRRRVSIRTICDARPDGWAGRGDDFSSPSVTKNWPVLLELQGVSFRANLHPGCPIIRGDIRFATWPGGGLGAIRNGSAAKGKYRGLYLNGERWFFRYEVDGTPVLEMFEVVKKDGMIGFARTIQLGRMPSELDSPSASCRQRT